MFYTLAALIAECGDLLNVMRSAWSRETADMNYNTVLAVDIEQRIYALSYMYDVSIDTMCLVALSLKSLLQWN